MSKSIPIIQTTTTTTNDNNDDNNSDPDSSQQPLLLLSKSAPERQQQSSSSSPSFKNYNTNTNTNTNKNNNDSYYGAIKRSLSSSFTRRYYYLDGKKNDNNDVIIKDDDDDDSPRRGGATAAKGNTTGIGIVVQQQQDEFRSSRRRRQSAWDCNATITPMTSRPHFFSLEVVQQQLQQTDNANDTNNMNDSYSSSGSSSNNNNNSSSRNDDGGNDDDDFINDAAATFSDMVDDGDEDQNNNNNNNNNESLQERRSTSKGRQRAQSFAVGVRGSNNKNNHHHHMRSSLMMGRRNESGEFLLVPSSLSLLLHNNNNINNNNNVTTGKKDDDDDDENGNSNNNNNEYEDDEEMINSSNKKQDELNSVRSRVKADSSFLLSKHHHNDDDDDHHHHHAVVSDADGRHHPYQEGRENGTNFHDTNDDDHFKKGSSSHHKMDADDATKQKKQNTTNILMCVLYGIINATIVLPVVMSFGSIIYRDDLFRPYQPKLISLTVFSGIVHQLAFTTFSTLPFAVGSVQDAGLIFLSAIASIIVQHCQESNNDNTVDDDDDIDIVILATVTVLLACCTIVLGLSLIVMGKLQLAQYVQLLPTCVVGGYLAYIGWFCGSSGIRLMANTSDITIHSLFYGSSGETSLTTATATIPLCWYIVPGVVSGIGIYVAVCTLRHMAVLPSCIFLLLLSFHFILWYMDITVQQATDNGWIPSMDANNNNNNNLGGDETKNNNSSSSWLHTWDYLLLHWDKVDWSVTPKLILIELSMIFVVALSSSLDVAAIELELQEQQVKQQQHHQRQSSSSHTSSSSVAGLPAKLPLDYNHELKTVGLSNVLSGLAGGYTGSYIFSQSIFSLRVGIRSRLCGYVLALCQFTVMVLPVPVLSYVPNFVFGSLLTMICVDLMYEWLWHVRNKITTPDYAICWVTFVSIQLFGSVEYGIFCGLATHVLYNKLVALLQVQRDDDSLTIPILQHSNKYGTPDTAKNASMNDIDDSEGSIRRQANTHQDHHHHHHHHHQQQQLHHDRGGGTCASNKNHYGTIDSS